MAEQLQDINVVARVLVRCEKAWSAINNNSAGQKPDNVEQVSGINATQRFDNIYQGLQAQTVEGRGMQLAAVINSCLEEFEVAHIITFAR